jgi:FkbM family methyltransferase
MALIHQQPLNRILRTVLRPFSSVIPKDKHFAIDGDISINLTEGKKMAFTGNPTSNLLRVLFWGGYKGFEPQEYDIFVHIAKNSKVLFDVGANLGYYSILGRLFNPDLKVFCFEPMPDARTFLEKNITLNKLKNISISPLALSENNGTASFYANRNPRFPHIKEHLFGDNSLDKNFTSRDTYEQIEIKVQTDTMDNFVKNNLGSLQIDFLKMDTEGSENLVLRGAGTVLKEHQPVIMCEIVRGVIETEIEQILRQNGYQFYRIVKGRLVKTDTITAHQGKEDYFMATENKLNVLRAFF